MKQHRLLAVLTLPTLLTAVAPAAVYAAATTQSGHQTLKRGDQGAEVVQLQNDLNALGLTIGEAVGIFGPKTTAEVKAFQTKNHMTADGVVGPGTWAAIDNAMKAYQSQPVQLAQDSKAVTHLETKAIYFGNQLMTSPSGFTYNKTDYMPIWYVMHTLDQMGLSHTWSNNVWNIVVPKSANVKVDYSNIKYGKGSTSIAINGTVVARVDGAVHVDPASGKPTMFMPTWYVMNALKRIGIASSWQGTTWKMTPPSGSGLAPAKTASSSGGTGTPVGTATGGSKSGSNSNTSSQSGGTGANSTTTTGNSSSSVTLGNSTTNNSTSGGSVNTATPTNGASTQNGSGVNTTTVGNSTTAGNGVTTGTNSATNSSGITTGSNSSTNASGITTGNGSTVSNGTGVTTGNGTATGTNTQTGTSTSTSSTTSSKSFTNVDLRFPAPSDINANSIDEYLFNHNSPMTGLGSSFITAQNIYDVDANYLVSHAILESYWGQSQIALAKNNLFGYGAYDANPGSDAGKFPSDDYAIRFQAWEVRNNYLDPNAGYYVSPTLKGMNVHYATDPNWAHNIGGLMSQLATSVGSSVNDYPQYPNPQPAPQPSSTTEPVYYFSGATAVIKPDPYYPITQTSHTAVPPGSNQTSNSSANTTTQTSTSNSTNHTTATSGSNTTGATTSTDNTTTHTTTTSNNSGSATVGSQVTTGANNTSNTSGTTGSTNTNNQGSTSQGSTTLMTGVPYFPDMKTGQLQMFFQPLQQGSSGEPVGEVQTFLNQRVHANLQVDGQFGPDTTAAVKQFEASQGLPQDGIFSYQMWNTYINSLTSQPLIPAGTSVTIDQMKEGMAGGYVVPWYHIPNFGWVDSEYVQLTDVYRLEVSDPAGTNTSIPVYSTSNPAQQIATLHSGDFVVAQSPTPVNGSYQIQFAAQTLQQSGRQPGTQMVGLVRANGQYSLVSQP